MSPSFAILYTAEDGVIIQGHSPARQTSGWVTADLLLWEYYFVTCGFLGRAETNMLEVEVT